MFSTLSAGRTILITSLRSGAPKYAIQTIQYTSKPTNLAAFNNLNQNFTNAHQPVRLFSKTNGTLSRFSTRAKPVAQTVAERAVPRADIGTVNQYGMLILGLAGAGGIGALCYYGLGMSSEEGTLERSLVWPKYVRDRISSTYMYLGTGVVSSVAAACAAFKSPAIIRVLSSGSFMVLAGMIAAQIASHTILNRIPYEPGFGLKQMAWIGHCSLLGAMIAPISFIGGPAILRAATYTAGIVGGLSAIAVCAPSEKFLVNTAPLSIGLGAVVAATLGSYFLPPTSKIGLGLYGVAIYGGIIVFSGLLLYDTQKTIKRAEMHPIYSMAPYDPICNAEHIYLDILNIFVRMAQIFAMGGQRRK